MQHRVRRVVHQVATVKERHDLHAGRQNPLVKFLHLGVNVFDDRVGVGALAQQDDAFDHVRVVHNLAVVSPQRLADLPESNARTLGHGADIFDAQRRAVLRFDDRVFDVLDVGNQADGAHVDLLQAGFDEAPAGIHVVIRQLLFDLPDGQAIGDQPARIDSDLIFPRDAAEADNIHHVGHGLELFFKRPVFERLQLHQVILRISAFQRVPVDLANGAVVRPDGWLQIVGKADECQPLQNFLAVPVVFGIVVKNHGDAGQAEQGGRAQILKVR